MKILLAVLATLCFVAVAPVLVVAYGAVNSNLESDHSGLCTSITLSNGATEERCNGTDSAAGHVSTSLLAGALLVSGSVLALASVSAGRRGREVMVPGSLPPTPAPRP